MTAVTETITTAWRSGTGITHLDLDCAGLQTMREKGHDPALKFDQVPFKRPADLIVNLGHRESLCRLCGVEPALVDALSPLPSDQDERQVFVTFTISRPVEESARRRRAAPTGERALELAELAANRLRRIASTCSLQTTPSPSGAAAFGFVPASRVSFLERVVHTECRHSVTELPPAALVSTFWSLLKNTDQVGPASEDPWFVAELLFAEPASES